MRLSAKLKNDFSENGYVLIPNLLKPKQVSELREKVISLAKYEIFPNAHREGPKPICVRIGSWHMEELDIFPKCSVVRRKPSIAG